MSHEEHEKHLDLLNARYKLFTNSPYNTPLSQEVMDLITFVEGYRFQACVLLDRLNEVRKIIS